MVANVPRLLYRLDMLHRQMQTLLLPGGIMNLSLAAVRVIGAGAMLRRCQAMSAKRAGSRC
jgi:hypothetical protein